MIVLMLLLPQSGEGGWDLSPCVLVIHIVDTGASLIHPWVDVYLSSNSSGPWEMNDFRRWRACLEFTVKSIGKYRPVEIISCLYVYMKHGHVRKQYLLGRCASKKAHAKETRGLHVKMTIKINGIYLICTKLCQVPNSNLIAVWFECSILSKWYKIDRDGMFTM